MAEASHERQRLFPRHFVTNENRAQTKTARKVMFFMIIPSRLSYKPVGKDSGVLRSLLKRPLWIL